MKVKNFVLLSDETIFQEDGSPVPIVVYEFSNYTDNATVQSDYTIYDDDPFAYDIYFINQQLLQAQELVNKKVPEDLDAEEPYPRIMEAQIIRNNAARPLIQAIPIQDTSLHINVRDTAPDITVATNIINAETDVLNGKIQGAMDIANAANTGRKKTSTEAVYGVATAAKSIISAATTEFNTRVASAKLILQTNFLGRPSKNIIDPNLLNTYKALLKDLFRGLYNRGHVIFPDKNGLSPPPKPSNYEVTDVNMIGFGHVITPDEQSSGSIYGISRWKKINKNLGISDDQLDAILNNDIINANNAVKQRLSADDWLQINTNYPNILIILIELTRTNATNYSGFIYSVTEKDLITKEYKNIGYLLLNSPSFVAGLKREINIPYKNYPKNTVSYKFSEQFLNTVLGLDTDTIDNSFTGDNSSTFYGDKYSDIFKSYIVDK